MPHTSTAARQRSNNPQTRNSLFDASPFSRKIPPLGGGLGGDGPVRAFPTLPPNRPPGVGGPILQPPNRPLPFPITPLPPGLLPPGLSPGLGGGGGLIPGEAPTPGKSQLSQLMFLDNLRRNDRLGYARALEFIRGGELEQGTGATAEAARGLAGALQNNPFISVEGLGNLQRGVGPLLNQIDPAFFRNTSPVIVQSLLGLLQSLGQRPEDVIHFIQATRPVG